jgi:hypothetical protein
MTTREKEADRNEAIAWAVLALAMVMSIFITYAGIMIYDSIRFPKKSICDIGADAIAGDYKLVGDSWYDGKSCAVQDCVAFNKFQEQLGSEQRCVV